MQHIKLRKSGIFNYFKTIINYTTSKLIKLNLKVFNHAQNLANIKANTHVMIGDNFYVDIKGFLGFGFSAVFLKTVDWKIENKTVLVILNLCQ